jgi:hypothetical protein
MYEVCDLLPVTLPADLFGVMGHFTGEVGV